MKGTKQLTVKYHSRVIGTLAETKDGRAAFAYSREWLNEGFSISPLSLPLEDRVFLPKTDVLEGLFGVFADSLPDGWGRLLVDRMLLSRRISPALVSAIERLGIVGSSGMGALEYEPKLWEEPKDNSLDFDHLAKECEKILKEKDSRDLDLLFQMGGSSGGARPKVLVTWNGEPWIVKFPSFYDKKNIGEEEYCYMKCAGNCGIVTPEIHLFPSEQGKGYFGVKRFDRKNGEKVHMVTVSGLLETSHRIPNLDYRDLMKLTWILTKDERELEQMYRRMCFNVFAHNRDDHSKNFSYLYDEEENRWKLTPVYDLTYSSSIGGEHASCINGNGKNPGMEDLIAVGKEAGFDGKKLKSMTEEIAEIIKTDLHGYTKEKIIPGGN